MMKSNLDLEFKKFIDECDKEQLSDLDEPEQWEIDLDEWIDKTYFKPTVPSVSDTE